ncbi:MULTISPECIES: MFS transporter [unclassified Nocardioides]|uniref:MFS transporter n=1 Tax=unclassified Nocardioides TaxID=2615069 RepID=UPI00070368E9|nr:MULTISPECIES: MFS transporter [unclassified Nocardioides]KRC48968.1 hypothetical protein ASE19_18895 [Nocardioides sp. Root79]KRC75369.1 hypothetical protein ASE20_20800 [Nocardioides sp. Root240]
MRAPLQHYPSATTRAGQLAVVILVTVTTYYAVNVHGAVSTLIIDRFDMSLGFYVTVSILGNLLGAFASLATGVTDRFGRVDVVVVGMAAVALLTGLVIPAADTRGEYLTWSVLSAMVEGFVLVLTPTLVRDFSPQLSRGTAIGIWALGPVLGNLLATQVASRTLDAHPDWAFQFRVCGVVGAVATVVVALTLRELAPAVRNQVVHDARAQPVGATAPTTRVGTLEGFRVMLTPRIVLPALGFALFLLFYVTRLGFFVIYFATTFGYTAARANALENWSWTFTGIGLVLWGFVGDRIGARKPLIVAGLVVGVAAVSCWAVLATRPGTSYATWAVILSVAALGGSAATANWQAAFTEAVENHRPDLVATGMAVWGWILRVVGASAAFAITLLVPAAGVLVDHGPEVSRISTTYAAELATLRTITPEHRAALTATTGDPAAQRAAVGDIVKATGVPVPEAAAALAATGDVPAADLAYLQAHGPDVAESAKDSAGEWQRWWWVCVAGELVALALVFTLPGPWRPAARPVQRLSARSS